MNKYDRFFKEYCQIKNEAAQLDFLTKFMLSLEGEEVVEFVMDNINKIKQGLDDRSASEAELETFYQNLDKGIASLQEMKKKAAA